MFIESMFIESNSKNMLSIRKVSHRKSRRIFTPFELGCNRHVPYWWRAYNKTKHELPEGAKCATIENTINALGALLILLHTSRILIEFDDSNLILDCNNWTDNEKSFYDSYSRLQYSHATDDNIDNANRNYFYSKQRKLYSTLFYYLSECKYSTLEMQ
jgi:hypothetical protein